MSQIRSFPNVGVKIKHISNHQLARMIRPKGTPKNLPFFSFENPSSVVASTGFQPRLLRQNDARGKMNLSLFVFFFFGGGGGGQKPHFLREQIHLFLKDMNVESPRKSLG